MISQTLPSAEVRHEEGESSDTQQLLRSEEASEAAELPAQRTHTAQTASYALGQGHVHQQHSRCCIARTLLLPGFPDGGYECRLTYDSAAGACFDSRLAMHLQQFAVSLIFLELHPDSFLWVAILGLFTSLTNILLGAWIGSYLDK